MLEQFPKNKGDLLEQFPKNKGDLLVFGKNVQYFKLKSARTADMSKMKKL